ncbi:hypothetical protein M3P05_06595 [Sansalvadorimonas sp. 2012CJ34-2]|uniref:Uncharacterized protein n=1 Tax=Parendozoicomonas callyspongiae TaxID=2942213 RepID=A0ABT0PGH6_9GAMM|nr:hypothetical protein [Sansalvadorimonas sp. 2012CJ34-2]MCL6269608.1 hypothetical protein [Sansalvadorimonas sp. 2012CJ34-2]
MKCVAEKKILEAYSYPNVPDKYRGDNLQILDHALNVAEYYAEQTSGTPHFYKTIEDIYKYFEKGHIRSSGKISAQQRELIHRLAEVLLKASEAKPEKIKVFNQIGRLVSSLRDSGYGVSPTDAVAMDLAMSELSHWMTGKNVSGKKLDALAESVSCLVRAAVTASRNTGSRKGCFDEDKVLEVLGRLNVSIERLLEDNDFKGFHESHLKLLSEIIDDSKLSKHFSPEQLTRVNMLLARGYFLVSLKAERHKQRCLRASATHHLAEAQKAGMSPVQELEGRLIYAHLLAQQEKNDQLQDQLLLAAQAGSRYAHNVLFMSRLGLHEELFLPGNPVKALKLWLKGIPQSPPTWFERLLFNSSDLVEIQSAPAHNCALAVLNSISDGRLDAKGQAYLHQLEILEPVQAELLESILLIKQGRADDAVEKLVPLIKNSGVAAHLAGFLVSKSALGGLDPEQIQTLYNHAILGGDCSAGLDLGRLYISRKEYDLALEILEPAADFFRNNHLYDELTECHELLNSIPHKDADVVESSNPPPKQKPAAAASRKRKPKKEPKQESRVQTHRKQNPVPVVQTNAVDVINVEDDEHSDTSSDSGFESGSKGSTPITSDTEAGDPLSSDSEPSDFKSVRAKKGESYSLTQRLLDEVNSLVKEGVFDEAQKLLDSCGVSHRKQLMARKHQMQAWLYRRRFDESDYLSVVKPSLSPATQRREILGMARKQALQGLKVMLPSASDYNLENNPESLVDIEKLFISESKTLASLFAELGHAWRRLSSGRFDSPDHKKSQKLSAFADSLNPKVRRTRGLAKMAPAEPKVAVISQEEFLRRKRGGKA